MGPLFFVVDGCWRRDLDLAMKYSPLPPFAAWSGPRDAKLVIVGEAWGRHEAEMRKPFVGESGKLLFEILGEAFGEAPELHREIVGLFRYDNAWTHQREEWLEAAGIAFTNVLNIQPYNNKIPELCVKKAELPSGYSLPAIEKSLYLDPQYLPELERLWVELSECKPNLIVAAGSKASWALLHDTRISSIRGAITQSIHGQKVLPTYHPAALLRQWAWRPIVVADMMKAQRERKFAEIRRPSRQIIYSPTIQQVLDWTAETLEMKPLRLASDTETAKGQITMISFARSRSEGIVIPFWDQAKPGWSYWTEPGDELAAWDCAEKLLTSLPIVWQNGLYDLQYITPMAIASRADDDLMLLHHSLLPEVQKGLGFLGSIYTSEPAWKLMRKTKTDTTKRDE